MRLRALRFPSQEDGCVIDDNRLDCDLLVRNATIFTMDADESTHRPGAIAVSDGEIAAVGAEQDVIAGFRPGRVIDARGAVVHPGFVEGHVHISEQVIRGSLNPEEFSWDEALVWSTAWHNAMEPEDEEVASRLACLEMVRNGTTCFQEPGTVFEPDAAAAAAEVVGIRGSLADCYLWDLGAISREQPSITRAPADTKRALRILGTELRRNADARALVRGHVAIYGIGSCSDELTLAAKACADENGVVFNQHQSYNELDTGVSDRLHGRHPLVHYADLGVLGPNCNFVHMNIVRADEVAPVVESGLSITWCPSASMLQGVGGTFRGRHVELYEQGVNVALGSDAVGWAGAFDLPVQAFLAVLTAREKTQRQALAAADALRMTTINGARAVGLADKIGSLEVGKRADIVVHRSDLPEAQPVLDEELVSLDRRRASGALQSVMYSSQSKSVDTVIIDGDIVVENGRSTRIDEEQAYRDATDATRRVFKRMGDLNP